MTIGIDARMYGAAQTGIGTYIEHLIKNLLKIDPDNFYKVFLMEPEFSNFKIKEENVKKIKVSSRWYGWREQLILPWQMMKENVDLMHFPHFNAPILYRKKFTVTIHDLTPLYFPGRKMGSSWFRRKSFKWVFGNVARGADKIIAVSNYTKNDLIKSFKVDENKIKVIHEGVKLLSLRATLSLSKGSEAISREERSDDPLDKYGIASSSLDKLGTPRNDSISSCCSIARPYIFYAGVWREHKNLVGLIKSFDILINKYKLDLQLVLGGKEDPYYPEIRKTWETLGLKDRVITPGFLDEEALADFYKNAFLFVIPSFAEGFGFVGLEAMAAGTPVAASNTMSLPEVLGDAAVYFDPHDVEDMASKMHRVFVSDNLRNELIQKGYENIQRFSWRKMAEETLKLYEEILWYNKRKT